uniref:Uncharacterized protein n=1 Tax=Grammatophora oceanica TaxID=210454 RepID=A0A7S1Y2R5_9STRA|mmetsp:Transcript_13484/g.19834  ORF Transcript_13484/g.19834 Transcript_13484/m.19834 type:complete len:115 (+) Transcript_13484:156-500(+)
MPPACICVRSKWTKQPTTEEATRASGIFPFFAHSGKKPEDKEKPARNAPGSFGFCILYVGVTLICKSLLASQTTRRTHSYQSSEGHSPFLPKRSTIKVPPFHQYHSGGLFVSFW